jgi:DNA-binding IscR family transcriptional regulator
LKSIKFVTACYILSFVAYHGAEKLSTPTIARWVNTNASRVRQIVSMLVRAGLLESTLGGSGGVIMGRDPETIRLLDVFNAVAEQELEFFSIDNPFSDWKDRCLVHSVLTTMRGELERDFRAKLAATSVSSLYAPPTKTRTKVARTKSK